MSLRTIALSPIIVPQALWVAMRANRLPEASGSRLGECGTGPIIRLLVLGDSSAAGVGVDTQSQALGGQLANKMAERYSVQWEVVARSGGTVRSTNRILETLPKTSFDIALVALGVNDAKNGVTLDAWTSGYRHLLDTIAHSFGTKYICVSGLPPVRHFPILPRPLNHVLGDRFELFDNRLRLIADERPDVIHLPTDFTLDTTKMATDGFHPGPDIYSEWANLAAATFINALK